MNEIDKYISKKKYSDALGECVRSNYNYLGKLICIICNRTNSDFMKQFDTNITGIKEEGKLILESKNKDDDNLNPNLLEKSIRVKLLCNWESSKQLRENLNKLTQGDYTWNNIEFVLDDDPDYFVVINSPPINEYPEPSKTIIFQMEPYMGCKNKHLWGEWSSPDPEKYFRVCSHKFDYNNNEWHLSKTYSELKKIEIVKTKDVLSTVLSSKYSDPGHIKRINFVKFLESKGMNVHVFGDNKWKYKDYKGPLPIYQKDNAMFPYKYVFNCENNSIKNYYTEKIIDAILAECLCFYSGCYNISEYIDERAYVYLELSNFEDDYQKVKKAIEDNLWEKRIDIIRKEKRKILEYLSFCPRLERIINRTEDQIYSF
jgi:hypothetical protein